MIYSDSESARDCAYVYNAGMKIRAIKLYRRITGLGLVNAKDEIEHCAAKLRNETFG